jgi:hypothetical protein
MAGMFLAAIAFASMALDAEFQGAAAPGFRPTCGWLSLWTVRY